MPDEEESKIVDVEKLQDEVIAAKENQDSDFSIYHGRRYPTLGNYYMPNDAPEIQRLNDQHLLLTLAKDGSLHRAPIIPTRERPIRVLDVGCGSGIWCLQLAERYGTGVHVTGMDVSAIQPVNKPENVDWVQCDMEAETWPFEEESFDFNHLSLVHGCIASWPDFYREKVLRLCRQYLLDPSTSQPVQQPENIDEMPPLLRWGHLMERASNIRGRPLQLGPHLTTFHTSAGLVDTEEKVYRIPSGTWSKVQLQREIGARMMLSAIQGMEGFTTIMFTKVLGWELEDVRTFVEEVRRDLRDDGMRKILDLHVVWSQKPLSVTQDSSGDVEREEELVHTSGTFAENPQEAWRTLLGSQSVKFASGIILGSAAVAVVVS